MLQRKLVEYSRGSHRTNTASQTSQSSSKNMVKDLNKYLCEAGDTVEQRHNVEQIAETEMRAVAMGNSQFARTLYEMVKKSDGAENNIILAPFSISSVMATAAVGARGETLTEITEGI